MQEPVRLALEAAEITRLQAEAEQGSEQAQREADERRADLNESALDAIHATLDGQPYTPETPETVASILRAIGMPVRATEESSRQHFAVVIVMACEDGEDAESVEDSVCNLVGTDESVLYVGPACPLGVGFRDHYSTVHVCIGTADRRGVVIATPGAEPTGLPGQPVWQD